MAGPMFIASTPALVVAQYRCSAPYAINLVCHRTNARLAADVASDRHARKCADMGIDGTIAVAAGAEDTQARFPPSR